MKLNDCGWKMASMNLGSFPVSFSVPAVGSYVRTKTCARSHYEGCYLRKVSWYKGQKIQTAYPIERHHCRCIEATSTSKKCTKSYVVKAVSGELFESESQDPSPKSLLASAKDSLNTFIRFIRPVALMASVIKIICISLIAVENLSDISPTYFIGLFKALAVILPINIYVVGVNHLADYEIDKINKPNLPLASGEYSFGAIAAIVASSVILSFGLAWIVGSPQLFWVISSHFIAASVYSINLPLLRWKKSFVLTPLNIVLDRAIILQLGVFLYMQTNVFKRPITLTKSLIFSIIFSSLSYIAKSIFKDIPDTEGDKKFGIRSASVLLGQEKAFWISISLLGMTYGLAFIFVGATSSCLWRKLISGLGYAFLASILWHRAKSIDVKDRAATESFYVFLWKLFFAGFCILPLVR